MKAKFRVSMNTRKLVFFTGTGLVFVVLLCMPWLMGLGAPRQLAFTWLGKQLGGSLRAESCSFGWFSGLRCQGFSYLSLDRQLQLTSAELRLDKGLMPLVLAPGNLGNLRLLEPELTIQAAAAPERPDTGASSRLIAWWNRSALQLGAQDGRVFLRQKDGRIPLLSAAKLSGALENGSLRFTLRGRAGSSAEPNLRAEGFINAPPDKGAESAHLLSTSTIVLESGKVTELPQLFGLPLADMDGNAAGSCRMVRGADGVVQLQGALSLNDLVVPALASGNERLHVGKASLLFDISRQSARHWQVQQLQLHSDLADVEAQGRLADEKGSMRLAAELSLPRASEALRQSLNMHADARLLSGMLRCTLAGEGPLQALPLRLHCESTGLEAIRGADRMHWKKPFILSVQGIARPAGLRLRAARLQAAFVQMEAGPGKGEGEYFVRATGALGALSQELGKMLHLPLAPRGNLNLTAERKDLGALAREDTLRCTIDNFSLHSATAALFPAHRLSLRLTGAQTEEGIKSATLHGEWWPGSFEGRLEDVRGQGAERSGRYSLGGTILLARLQPLVQHFLPDRGSLSLAGSLNLELSARLQGFTHQLTSLEAVLNKPLFKAETGKAVYSFQASRSVLAAGEALNRFSLRPPKGLAPLALAANLKALAAEEKKISFLDLQAQRARLAPWLLSSDGLQLQGELTLEQWRQERPRVGLQTHGHMDGAVLTTLLRASSRMPPGLQLQGRTQLAFDFDYPGKPLAEAVLAAQLDQVGFGQNGRQFFQERGLSLYARFEAADSSSLDSWDLPEFSVHNEALWAQGKGFLWRESTASAMLALQGRYRRTFTAAQTPIESVDDSPFQLSVPLR